MTSKPRRSWSYAPILALFLLVGTAFAQEGEPIVFGGALPLTGWGSDAGQLNLRGYELWEQHINEDGGLLGRPVELLIYDDQSDPTTTARLYERLINQDQVDVLLAPWSDDMTMPATTVSERYGKPMVTGGATLDEIWSRGYQYVTGLLPSSYDYVGVPLRMLEGMVSTAYLVNADLTFTSGFADAAEVNLDELGIEPGASLRQLEAAVELEVLVELDDLLTGLRPLRGQLALRLLGARDFRAPQRVSRRLHDEQHGHGADHAGGHHEIGGHDRVAGDAGHAALERETDHATAAGDAGIERDLERRTAVGRGVDHEVPDQQFLVERRVVVAQVAQQGVGFDVPHQHAVGEVADLHGVGVDLAGGALPGPAAPGARMGHRPGAGRTLTGRVRSGRD